MAFKVQEHFPYWFLHRGIMHFRGACAQLIQDAHHKNSSDGSGHKSFYLNILLTIAAEQLAPKSPYVEQKTYLLSLLPTTGIQKFTAVEHGGSTQPSWLGDTDRPSHGFVPAPVKAIQANGNHHIMAITKLSVSGLCFSVVNQLCPVSSSTTQLPDYIHFLAKRKPSCRFILAVLKRICKKPC